MNLTLSTLPPTLKTWLKLVTAVLMGLMMLWSAHLWNLSTTSVDSGVQDQKPITVLHAAEFNTTTQPGPAGPRFESVQLPHRLGNQHNAYMHYRVLLPTDAHTGDAHSLSLCVPRWSARPVVWLDGQKLLDHANSHLAVTALQRPTYLALPPLSPDKSHWLDIQLRAVPGTFPGLSEIWLGDDRAVNTACHAMVENNSGARIGSLYLMIFLTLMSAGVTLYQRENLARGFAVLGFLWCLYAMIALGWIPFLNDEVWLACMHLTRPLPGLAAIWFVQRLINQKFRLINRLLVVMAVLAYAIFPFLPQEQWNFWLIVVGSCLLPLTAIVWTRLIWFAAKSDYLSDFTFTVTMFFGIGANVIDIARSLNFLPFATMSLTHLLVPVLAIAIGFVVLERLQEFLRAQAQSARLMAQKLLDQKIQLDASHELMQQQQKKLVLNEERQRMVRDLHDGLGTQLVSASALLKSGALRTPMSHELSDLIDHALLDLRSLLDVFSSTAQSYGQQEDTVTVLLSMLRHRLSPVFRAKGIELDWDGQPLPPHFLPEDRQRLQLLRLLQEACANIIKHAQASKVILRTWVEDQIVTIEVQDNGRGMRASETTPNPRPGNGLNNMAVRANKLGAQMTIQSTDEGTCIRLVFPPSAPAH